MSRVSALSLFAIVPLILLLSSASMSRADDAQSPDLSAADAAFDSGQYAKAYSLYNASAKDGVLGYEAQVGVARCFMEVKQYTESESAFDEAIKLDDNRFEAYAGRGMAKWLQDKNKDAIVDLQRAIEINDQSVDGWLYLALSNQSLGKHDDALKLFDKAVALDDQRWFSFFQRAKTHLALDDPAAAIADYTRAIEINPNNTNAHRQRAIAYQQQEQYAEAIADINQRLAVLPLDTDSIEIRAEIYQASEELLMSARDYSALIGMNTNVPESLKSRGGCYMELELYQASIDDYLAASKLAPDQWTYANLATCYEYLDEYEKVDGFYTEALKLDPEYELALVWRAYARQRLKRFTEAKADYLAALKAGADDDPIALGNLSWLLSGCPDETVRDGRLALELATKANELYEGKQAWVVDNIAAAHAELGDFDNAVTWVQKAIELAESEEEQADIRTRLELYQNKQPARIE
ncbi:tetratricopeptide repeat protein [Stieleria varia]|uniref:Lipoprotein NlpI n=1 Tax=Stieleria varia TaxID=2528005 RepID=A0A5C6A433_9BACT|nr:tetratricopeptide repeat protein [Stieleria varia]TWT93901.1 lipoprotein NlpI [Stieleria varia]